MKKVKFRNAGRAMYLMLCVGLLAVGVASVAGYRAAVSSVTEGLVTPKDESSDIDYSAVDAVLSDIKKAQTETPTSLPDASGAGTAPAAEAPETAAPSAFDSIPEGAAPSAMPEKANENTPANEALVDVTDELEALYYEQAVMMPINGDIIEAYSEGELVKTAGGVWRTHDGVDIAAEEGSKVRAMTSGTVTDVYRDPLWGCCVVIDHGNTLSGCYYGLSEDLPVTVGQRVNAGDEIGAVGNTADIEADLASHLHFALKYENRWIDPVSYIEPMK